MEIREFQTDEEFLSIFPFIRQLNPDMTEDAFRAHLAPMRGKGYRCVGVFENETCLGICGFWIHTRFYSGSYIDIDNLVVQENSRNQGIGKTLVAWIEEEGRRQGCRLVMLDSYLTNGASHRFYFREGFTILGFHFKKDLDPEKPVKFPRFDNGG